jgi:hypothetical protein
MSLTTELKTLEQHAIAELESLKQKFINLFETHGITGASDKIAQHIEAAKTSVAEKHADVAATVQQNEALANAASDPKAPTEHETEAQADEPAKVGEESTGTDPVPQGDAAQDEPKPAQEG